MKLYKRGNIINTYDPNAFKPITENSIILDFTHCQSLGEIHQGLKEKFDLPDYYGENLSALWDCLDGYCNYNLSVNIKGLDKMPDEYFDYMNEILSVFDDVHRENPNITFEIIL